jgi:hypothetical protein
MSVDENDGGASGSRGARHRDGRPDPAAAFHQDAAGLGSQR